MIVVLVVLLVAVWGVVLVLPRWRRRHQDVRQDVERQERRLRALGHAAGWEDDERGLPEVLRAVARDGRDR